MKKAVIFLTFTSRASLLVFNMALLILSTKLWGSEGRGEIALAIADLAIISFFSNIMTGSSVSYFASRSKTGQLIFPAYLWALLVGFTIPFLIAILHGSSDNLIWLVAISVIMALFNANTNLFVGLGKVQRQNTFLILQMVLHVLVILFSVFIINYSILSVYFLGLLISYAVVFLVSGRDILKYSNLDNFHLKLSILKNVFKYGFNSQISGFIQFLNYRGSFYFLEFFKGISSVGLFSVGAAISEVIWTFSRSISIVLYADIVSAKETESAIEKTISSLKVTLYVSIVMLVILLLFPPQFYVFLFGEEFKKTGLLLLLLSPGVLSVAVSNNIGHYFAGVNKLRILNLKSIVGLVVIIPASIFLIPTYGIEGACIATTLSYLSSSGVLFWKFYSSITTFKFSDYGVSRTEIQNLLLHLPSFARK